MGGDQLAVMSLRSVAIRTQWPKGRCSHTHPYIWNSLFTIARFSLRCRHHFCNGCWSSGLAVHVPVGEIPHPYSPSHSLYTLHLSWLEPLLSNPYLDPRIEHITIPPQRSVCKRHASVLDATLWSLPPHSGDSWTRMATVAITDGRSRSLWSAQRR